MNKTELKILPADLQDWLNQPTKTIGECDHDWKITGYAWPPGGRTFLNEPPEFVRLQCSKCGEDVEERWT